MFSYTKSRRYLEQTLIQCESVNDDGVLFCIHRFSSEIFVEKHSSVKSN
jgi:hypothetical protein